jgi:DNA-binding LacI/PurR family transcriptional regulator
VPLIRQSLAELAAAQIRRAIQDGQWSQTLPGGRELSRIIGVSRPTVHQALAILEAQGLVRGRTKAARVVRPGRLPSGSRARKVVFLSPYRAGELDGMTARLGLMVAAEMAARGHHLEHVRLARASEVVGERTIDSLRRTHNPACWILYRCSPALQGLLHRRGEPCVVLGNTPPELRLPGVDVDYAAAARHLGGRLGALGHRGGGCLLVLPAEPLVGHRLAAEAFQVGGESPRLLRLGQDALAATGQIDIALDQRPTAIVVQRPEQALSVVGRLWARGWRCPADLSLACLQDSLALGAIDPPIARYSVTVERLFKGLSRQLVSQLERPGRSGSPQLLLPELVNGTSLGEAPAAG